MRLMGECRGSIDAVKRTEGELTEDDDDMPGLTNPTSTDTQSAGQLHISFSNTGSIQLHCKHCASWIRCIYIFSSRCDRALGANPGSVPEWEAPAETEPAAVAAADLRPADNEGLAGSERGWTQPAARAWPQHWHTHHPAEDQEAQGQFAAHLCVCFHHCSKEQKFIFLQHCP